CDAGIVDHLRPFWHVRLDPRLELIRRHGRRLISYRRHFLLEARRSNRTRDLAVQKIDDLAWRTSGGPDALRCLLHLAGHTGFFHRRASGRIAIRLVLLTASARSRLSVICAAAYGSVANATGVSPPDFTAPSALRRRTAPSQCRA